MFRKGVSKKTFKREMSGGVLTGGNLRKETFLPDKRLTTFHEKKSLLSGVSGRPMADQRVRDAGVARKRKSPHFKGKKNQ